MPADPFAFSGIPWYIIQRGNNRSVCFYAENDYSKYLDTLREQAMKYGSTVFLRATW
jgi:putative transposase